LELEGALDATVGKCDQRLLMLAPFGAFALVAVVRAVYPQLSEAM
jgi:hypothetical protein